MTAARGFVERLAGLAVERPDALAYRFLAEDGAVADERSFGELRSRSLALAAWCGQRGMRGERALLLLPAGLQFVDVFFGCLAAGAVAVPAYPPTSRRSLERVRTLARDARPRVAITTGAVLARLRSWTDADSPLWAIDWLAVEDLDPGLAAEWRDPALTPADLAFLQYTSGSTSAPKGVMVSHGNLWHNQEVIRRACDHSEESVFVSWLPLYHDLGLIGNMLQALYAGAPCTLMSPLSFLQRPALWLEAVSRFRGTTSGGPNFAYELCLRRVAPGERQDLDLSSWRVAFNGAEPVRPETLERFADAFAPCGLRREALFPCYGLAEATLMVSGGPPRVQLLDPAALADHRAVPALPGSAGARAIVGCGPPLAGQTVEIVDPESRLRCAEGRVGEIWIAGPSVAQGYWSRPEETERTFRAFLAGSGEGPFLRTGDFGFLASGQLHVTGRLKDLIILRGRNYYPQDIELCAERSHPDLRPGGAAAFSVEIEGEERLVVVQELRRHAGDPLGAAEQVRRAVADEHEIDVHEVVLIRAGTLPKTTSGKVQRRACRDRYRAGELAVEAVSALPAPGPARTAAAPGRADLLARPAGERLAALETYLAGRVAAMLRIPADRLAPAEPLSGFGFDSLAAMELKDAVATDLGETLSLEDLLRGLSVRELAAGLAGRLAAADEPPTRGALASGAPQGPPDLPLSYTQRSLWFLHQLAPASGAYNIAVALVLPAGADGAALRRCFAALVARHGMLRTAIFERDGEAVQRVLDGREVRFEEIDASAWSDADLERALADSANRPFDLAREPLLRVSLFARHGREPVLLLTVHHLILDGWSLWILLDELGELYRAELGGRPAALAPVEAGYADFIRWQEELLGGPQGRRLGELWDRELAGGVPFLDLPTDHPRTFALAPAGGSRRFDLDPELTSALRDLARAHGTTLYVVLLSAFEVLLHRYSGAGEVVLGSPFAGRGRPEFRRVVGCFFNLLPLRVRLGDDPGAAGLLARTQARVLTALEHQDYPSHRLAGHLQGPRGAAPGSPWPIVFILQEPPHRDRGAGEEGSGPGGFGLDLLAVERRAARSELELEVLARGERASCWLHFSRELFEPATVARMAGHYRTLLAGIVADPERRISELPLLTAAERLCQLAEWSAGAPGEAPEVSVHQLFEQQVERTPDKAAVVYRGVPLSFREVDDAANGLAGAIRSRDGLVGLMVGHNPRLPVGLLGILKSGNGFVPVDPEDPLTRSRQVVADCAMTRLVTEEAHLARALALAAAVPSLEHILCLDGERGGGQSVAGARLYGRSDFAPRMEPATAPGTPDRLAYVIFTSGSTGVPKGVPISHRNLVPLLVWSGGFFGLGPGSRVLQTLSYGFDFGVFEILTTLLFGGTLFQIDREERRDLELYRGEIRRHGINTIHATPSFLGEVAALGGRAESLKLVHLGGEALSAGVVEAVLAMAGDGCVVYNGYGPTETSVNATIFTVGGREGRAAHGPGGFPIGRPTACNTAYVLDRAFQPMPAGLPGELCIGGPGLTRGYLGRPDLTAERFVPDPFGNGGRLYRTGDLVRFLTDGNLEFLGRIDHQVKIRGFRIEPGEVESLLREHPQVQEAVVVAREDGRGDRRLVAYLLPREPAPAAGELRAFLQSMLPGHMVPSAFVLLSAFPHTPSGKIDRAALPDPEPALPHPAGPSAEPRSLVEEILAGIWADVLGVGRVGLHDDFFELGGHSLLAAQLTARARRALGVELSVRDLFLARTVGALAVLVEAAAGRRPAFEAPPLVPVPRTGDLPLSYAQQRLWFLDQLEPENPFYNVSGAFRIAGPLRLEALSRGLAEIVRRHEVLRTRFPSRQGLPALEILPAGELAVPVVDLGALAKETAAAEAAGIVAQDVRRPFDLASGPLFRAMVLRRSESDHLAAVTMHHIVSDLWSTSVLLEEIAVLYEAFSAGLPSPLPEPALQYADYAHWQRQCLQGEMLSAQLAFWRQRLAGAPPVLDLPADRPRPAVQSFRGAIFTSTLPPELWSSLTALARRQGATPFMTLLAAFETLLGRLTGEEDVSVGSPVAGRNRLETEGLIGLFLNTVVLRTDLGGEPGFLALLERVREMALDAYAHQDLPFEMLVEELQPARALSYSPLFQVLFVMQSRLRRGRELPDLSIAPLEVDSGTSKFDLTLLLAEEGGGLRTAFEYSTDLFEAVTIARWAGCYRTLLAGIAADPDRPISQLSLLTGAEQHEVLLGWNDTAVPYPEAAVHEGFEAQAERTPEAPAVVYEGQRLTYADLNARANRLARYLRGLGVGPDVRVALFVERSPAMAVAVLAILKAGGAYVPLDPAYPADRLAFMVEDAKAPVLLTQERLLASLPRQSARIVTLDDLGFCAGFDPANPSSGALPDHLAYVMYTSGSTGRPKGIGLPHRCLANLIAWHFTPLRGGARTLQFSALSFDVSFHEMFSSWWSGGTVVLVPEALRPDMEGLAGFLCEEAIEKAILPVVVLHQLAEVYGRGETLPAALAEIITTGEQLQIVPAMVELFGRLSGSRLHNHYGPAETHVVTACELDPDPATWPTHPPVGRPIANTWIYLLDRGWNPVPAGVPGELFIGGVSLARGYLDRPDLTAAKFVPDPWRGEPGGRLYRTGDLARYRADGQIEYLGRIDHQVKIRGIRIEPGEIEAVLGQHPRVREAFVMVHREPGGDVRLLAYVVADRESPPSANELRAHLRRQLPEHMIPAAFVTLDALPLSPNKKVDRRALPVPGRERGGGAAFTAPRTPVEEIVAAVWGEVLGLREVSAFDNFFDSGGHSLLATQLVSRLRQAFQIDLPLRRLFEAPTVAELAAAVEAELRAGGPAPPPLEAQPRGPELPLSLAQERLWVLDQLTPGNPAYNVPWSLRLEGRLSVPVLQAAVGALCARHEVLRTAFAAVGGQPVQVIHPPRPESVPVIDLSGLGEASRQAVVRREAAAEARRPFDLARGPLLRLTLLRLGPEEHVLLLTLHHIIVDGWSTWVLTRELAALYAAAADGLPAPLPPLALQYADFALWQRRWMESERLEGELAYWRQKLAGAPDLLELPCDRARPPVQSFRGAELTLELEDDLARGFKALARSRGVTLFMGLMAGFEALLYHYTQRTDFLVGTDVANRNRLEIEGLIGFFVNELVLRADLAGDPSYDELLQRVREATLGAYAHQDLPFVTLVEALKPERDLAYMPLVQVIFSVQNLPAQELDVPRLRLSFLPNQERVARFDLAVHMTEREGRVQGVVEYSTDLFEASTIEKMMDDFKLILRAVTAHPEERLTALSARLSEADAERQTTAARRLQSAGLQFLQQARRREYQSGSEA